MGFSGGSHDRLRVSEVERIRCTVGTAEGAAGGEQKGHTMLQSLQESCLICELQGCHAAKLSFSDDNHHPKYVNQNGACFTFTVLHVIDSQGLKVTQLTAIVSGP